MLRKYANLLLLFGSIVCFGQQQSDSSYIDTIAVEAEINKLIDSSNTFYYRGNYVKSMEYNVRFLNKSLQINSPKYITQGYRFLGYDYLALNDTILAKESFEKSETYAKIAKNDTAIAKSYMDLANLYSTVYDDLNKAIRYHDKSIALFEKVHDSVELAKAHHNTILTAFLQEDFKKVRYHLDELKKYRDHQNEANRLGTLNQWGDYFAAVKDFPEADKFYTQNINTLDKEKYPIEMYEAYNGYSNSLFEQERFKEAFEALEKYQEIYVQSILEQQDSESKSVSAKYQVDEYKKDVEAAELQNKLQAEIVDSKSKLNNFLLIMSIAGFALFIGLLLAFRRRKQLVEKLKIKNKEYLEAKEQSERLALSKSNFFSTVSHELRTPLYGVIGLSTILLEDKNLKHHEKDLKSLKFSADYLLALINDVLQLNKIDSKNAAEEENNFNLRNLIEPIVSSFTYITVQHKNQINIIISDDVPETLKGNSVRLSQVLMNLVGNASKFTENGTIEIVVNGVGDSEKEHTLEFEIKDTGIGIAAEKQESIFNEFAQIENTNYEYQGTGLGLPIVKKLLKLSNSEIKLESTLGVGSKFSFRMKFAKVGQVESIAPKIILDKSQLEGKHILVVDDNRINQTVTTKILEGLKVASTIAENGKEAVVRVKENTFDLILMDLNMPVMDGFEASQAIKNIHPEIPIIALTAVEVEEVRNKIFKAGMNDIIVKPYDVTQFTQTILKSITFGGAVVVDDSEKKVV